MDYSTQKNGTALMVLNFFKISLTPVLVLILSSGFSQTRQIPFTLEDRDRIIQILEKMESQQKQINDLKETTQIQINGLQNQINGIQNQINGLQNQINELRNLFYWGFGIMISLIMFLFGFIIWDRRTVTEPIREKLQLVIEVLREYAKEQPKLSEILRSRGVIL